MFRVSLVFDLSWSALVVRGQPRVGRKQLPAAPEYSEFVKGASTMNWCKPDTGKDITVTVPTAEALLSDMANQIDAGQGYSIATLNLDHVVKLARDPDFRTAYAAHTYVTADGNPIVWLSRLAGQGNVTLVPGSELIDPIAALAARKGIEVALLGATENSLQTARQELGARHPGLRIALTLSPPMGFEPTGTQASAAISKIDASGARIVFLALGAPKQERFAAFAQTQLPQVGFVSIGAGLDFISGEQVRAPKWVRHIAAEWAWRLLANPKRLAARYAACFATLPSLTFRAFQARWSRSLQ